MKSVVHQQELCQQKLVVNSSNRDMMFELLSDREKNSGNMVIAFCMAFFLCIISSNDPK